MSCCMVASVDDVSTCFCDVLILAFRCTIGQLRPYQLKDIVEDLNLDLQVVGLASMFQIYFNPEPVLNYEIAKKSDTKRFLVYFRELLKNGVFIPPSQFECNFISGAHTEEDLVKTSEAIEAALKVAWDI